MNIKALHQRAIKIGWAASEGILNPLFQIVLTPLLLNSLGNTNFGTWVLFLTIISLGPLITISAAPATFNQISQSLANQQANEVPETFIAAAVIIIITSAIGTALIIIISALIPIEPLQNSQGLILLCGATILIQELDSVCSAAIKAHGKFDTSAKIDIIGKIVGVCSVAACAVVYGSALVCASAATGALLIKLALKIKACSRLFPPQSDLKTCWQSKQSKQSKSFLNTALMYWGQSAGGLMFNSADKFLVSSLFGLDRLSAYAICTQLAQFTHSIQASAGQTLLPWASKKFTSHNPSDLRALRHTALIGGLACLALPLTIAFLLDPILIHWIGLDFSLENHSLGLALLASYAALSMNIPLHYILLGAGEIKTVTAVNFIAGATALILGWAISAHGISALAMSKCAYAPITLLALYRLFVITRSK